MQKSSLTAPLPQWLTKRICVAFDGLFACNRNSSMILKIFCDYVIFYPRYYSFLWILLNTMNVKLSTSRKKNEIWYQRKALCMYFYKHLKAAQPPANQINATEIDFYPRWFAHFTIVIVFCCKSVKTVSKQIKSEPWFS